MSLRIRPIRRGRHGAFTLIEVLVTLVLIAIVLPVALEGTSLSLSAAGAARRNAEAAALAETKLNELVATQQWTSAALTGDFGADWPDYHWSAQSISRDTSLMELSVQVTWDSRGSRRSLSVSTLVYTAGGLTQ